MDYMENDFDDEDEKALESLINANNGFSPAFKKLKELKELSAKWKTAEPFEKAKLRLEIKKCSEEATCLHDRALGIITALQDVKISKTSEEIIEDKLKGVGR